MDEKQRGKRLLEILSKNNIKKKETVCNTAPIMHYSTSRISISQSKRNVLTVPIINSNKLSQLQYNRVSILTQNL